MQDLIDTIIILVCMGYLVKFLEEKIDKAKKEIIEEIKQLKK